MVLGLYVEESQRFKTRPSGARAGGGLDRGGLAGAVMGRFQFPKCVRGWRAEPMAARTGAGHCSAGGCLDWQG